jgi:hypothetical protein
MKSIEEVRWLPVNVLCSMESPRPKLVGYKSYIRNIHVFRKAKGRRMFKKLMGIGESTE